MKKPWAIVIENRQGGVITRQVVATYRTEKSARRHWDDWTSRAAHSSTGLSGGSRLIDQRTQTFEPIEHYDPTVVHFTCPDCGEKGHRDHFGACEYHHFDCPSKPGRH